MSAMWSPTTGIVLASSPGPPHGSGMGGGTEELVTIPLGGAGSSLPVWLLAVCGAFTAIATGVSVASITLQLKNYRKPALQRAVVRIMVMVPLYAISSLIALFSLEAAFVIDAVRDLYEAFVIYTFFQLLVTYLGGERSLLILLHGRPPIPHPFPFNLFLRPMDVSDPWTLLNLKRGILQYVQVKPFLVVATIALKATGTYKEGSFSGSSGYTYVSVVYNISICLSLYCLAMFWVAVSSDLKPFRPVPKFLCVKGILFFSFWQSIFISILVSAGAIKKVGVYRDQEHMSLALVDSLICFEMPIFAIAHQYAFQASDYIDETLRHVARLPFYFALRDSFGLKDVWEDTKDTLKGQGVSYQAYEPAEGGLHFGEGRMKRIRAGLRYSKHGTVKYWLPIPGDEARETGDPGPIARIKRKVEMRRNEREGYAPLLPQQEARVYRTDPEAGPSRTRSGTSLYDSDSEDSDAPDLEFSSAGEEEDALYDRARRIGYPGFPNIDVSSESAKRTRWEEEESILSGRRTRDGRPKNARSWSDLLDSHVNNETRKTRNGVYGAWADRNTPTPERARQSKGSRAKSSSPRSGTRRIEDDGDADAEREATTNGHPPNGTSARMKKSKIATGGNLPGTNSAFALGDDEDDDPSPPTSASAAQDERSRSIKALPDDYKSSQPDGSSDAKNGVRRLPSDARDLVTEDPRAIQRAQTKERRSGEPQSRVPARVLRHSSQIDSVRAGEVERVFSPDLPQERRESKDGAKNKEAEDEDGDVVPDAEEQIERMEAEVLKPTPPPTVRRDTGFSASAYADEDNPWA